LSSAATWSSSASLCKDRSLPFGKYWRNRPLMLLVAAALPGLVRVAEKDLDVGGDGDLLPVAHLRALVPGQ